MSEIGLHGGEEPRSVGERDEEGMERRKKRQANEEAVRKRWNFLYQLENFETAWHTTNRFVERRD